MAVSFCLKFFTPSYQRNTTASDPTNSSSNVIVKCTESDSNFSIIM